MFIRWSDSNLEHTSVHGVAPDEVESVIVNAAWPFPEYMGGEKWRVWGRGRGGRFIQVVFLVDEDGVTVYPIHARPLNDQEKKRLRRRRR